MNKFTKPVIALAYELLLCNKFVYEQSHNIERFKVKFHNEWSKRKIYGYVRVYCKVSVELIIYAKWFCFISKC